MYKIKIINFIVFLAIFCSCEFNNPTEGFKVEGSIANIQDYPSNEVMAFVTKDSLISFGAKVSESKLNNNYFSMFLPYKMKDKHCAAISTNKYIFFDRGFESYLTISNENVKVSKVLFNSDDEYYPGGNIKQFGYTEKYYYPDVASVTLVKTIYIYAQSAVAITGEYEKPLNVIGEDLYKTVKMDLFLQKGWNTVYYVGNYTSKPGTDFWEVDTAIFSITTEKPENIELKWYYDFRNKFFDILENINPDFIYMPYMYFYYTGFILKPF